MIGGGGRSWWRFLWWLRATFATVKWWRRPFRKRGSLTSVSWKTLTPLNWRDTDPLLEAFVQLGPDGTVTPMTEDDWTRHLLAVQLAASVPENVRALFDVARGAILYGSLFYPLFALGLEGIYRAADAATVKACEARRLPTGRDRFVDRLAALHVAGVLTDRDHGHWTALRHVRNEASHPESLTIRPPGDVLSLLRQIVGDINALFS